MAQLWPDSCSDGRSWLTRRVFAEVGHAERFARTIKESCRERMILFGEASDCRGHRVYVIDEASYRAEKVAQQIDDDAVCGS